MLSADKSSLLQRLLAPGRSSAIRLLLAACHVTVPRDHVTSSSRDQAVDSLLQCALSEPVSLQGQCRWVIRRVTSHVGRGRHFLSALYRLPLPKSLQDYTALLDELNHDDDTINWTQVFHQLVHFSFTAKQTNALSCRI